jgi:hypothetical protein
MSRKNKLIGTLSVLNALIFSYIAQISHVKSEVVAGWSLHDWVCAGLLVAYAGISNWKAFIINPSEAAQLPPKTTNF